MKMWKQGADTIGGLIIAGGHSSRMGRDKALLPVGGLLLIAVLLKRMARHCGRIIIAVGDERRAREYRAAIAQVMEGGAIAERRVAFALDRYAGCGPLAGLHAGLSELQTGWALLDRPDAVVVEPEPDEEREAFVNLNTPEAYEAYVAQLRDDPGAQRRT